MLTRPDLENSTQKVSVCHACIIIILIIVIRHELGLNRPVSS